MKLISGALARTTTGLNMRATPGGAIVATLVAGALVEALGKPVDGWVRVVARGWTQDGRTIYFETEVSAGKKLSANGQAAPGGWRFIEQQGAVAANFLDIVDGPE